MGVTVRMVRMMRILMKRLLMVRMVMGTVTASLLHPLWLLGRPAP